ncbi:MAG: hypothetical protein JKX85_08260 [Phycisphaeraceae bacterium]|nr:hypothetical protein [Phycisphaeraceae bacterium]
MNSKQVLITGLAIAVAIIFFIITMFAGPPAKKDPRTGGSDLLALKWDSTGSSSPKMRGLNIHFADDHGVVYELMGDSLTPKSQGVIDVIKPIARIHLKPNKTVLQIEANEGTFITPANETRSGMIGTIGQPQSGFLKGDVVIRVFENDGTKPIDLTAGSVNEILTMNMQQATFNRDLGEIEAAGLVQIDGRDVAFEGENLNIVYSPLRQRINRLEIEKGKFIRIKQIPRASRDDKVDASQNNPATQPAKITKTDKPNRSAQYYHITLNDNVTIEAQKNKLAGNQLQLFVGFENRDTDEQKASPTTKPKEVPSTQTARQPTTKPAQPNKLATPEIDDPNDDILITWTGPLLMLPTEQKPAMLANARDSYLQLLGSPMTITPASGDLITAATLDYLVSQSRLRIRSNNTYPLLIDSRQLGGLLTAKNYEMYLDKGLGLLLGEGELRSLNRPVIADATQTKAIKKQKSLPPGTSVSWKDRVELLFFKEAGKNKPLNFDAVKTITFRGKVDVQHDLLDVQSDTVTLHMTKPTEKKSKQETSLIEASGNVALRTHSPEPDKQMALHADIARIHFKPDSQGKMQPIQLTANDNVVIRQPQQVLWANKLTVDLVTGEQTIVAASDKPKTGEPQQTQPVNVLDTMLAWEDEQTPVPTVTDITTNPLEQSLETEKSDTEKSEDLSSLHVQLVTVEGDVRARLINNGQPVFAFAHRITGDENQVELFGNDQRPAQVIHDQGILAGGHMVLTPKDQNLHVIGQGTLSYISQPMGKKPKDAAPAQPATSKPQTTTGDEKISEIHIDATNNSPPPATTPESTTESITEKTPLIVDESDVIAAPALPSLDPAQVTVTWQDNMHYNHESRQAHFLGNVLLQARKMLSTTTVKGDDIRLLFNKFAHAKKPDNKQAPDMLPINDQGMVSTQSLEGGREVRMVNITGKAEFLEESWADPQKQNLLTRLQIAGDTIILMLYLKPSPSPAQAHSYTKTTAQSPEVTPEIPKNHLHPKTVTFSSPAKVAPFSAGKISSYWTSPITT